MIINNPRSNPRVTIGVNSGLMKGLGRCATEAFRLPAAIYHEDARIASEA